MGSRGGGSERRADGSVPGLRAEGLAVFVLCDGNGLEHGLAEIGEGGCDLGLDLALGDGGEKPSHGGAQIASGKQIREKESRYVLAGLFCGERFGFLLGVEVAEMQMAGAARSAALAAIGKGEGT